MTRHSVASRARQSMFSKLSRKTKSREKLPPPVLPITDLDNGVVGWDHQQDPEMPLNFTQSRKWLIVSLLSLITAMTPFASSILAPAIETLAKDLQVSSLTMASMPVSIFLLGYAVGPLVLSPLSEIYGRYVVFISATLWFCVWLIGCALAPSIETLVFFRFMSGLGGSACQTIGGAIIADVFPVSERGSAMALWMMGPIIGPSIGPVIGGFVAQTIGWRWTSWITLIPSLLATIGLAIFYPETNHRVLIARKTEKLRKELNRPELRSCYVSEDAPSVSKSGVLLVGLIRPIKMLFTSIIIFGASLYIAFAYGCLYLLFNTIPIVFEKTYHWSLGVTGLVYFSLLAGNFVGLAIFSRLSDRTVVRMTRENDGVYEPEMRLADCVWFGLFLPVPFFWYGWAADQAIHPAVTIIGLGFFGLALNGIWLPTQAYLVDAYAEYAASCLAAFAVLRCTVAAFLPLAGTQMYDTLGVGWGTSLLGFIAVGMIPIPSLIFKYGKVLREKFPVHL